MFLLAQTLALLAVALVAIQVAPLAIAQKSFDDRRLECNLRPTKVTSQPRSIEFLQNVEFAQLWSEARAAWQARGSPMAPLSQEEAIALMMYTSGDVHRPLNATMHKAGSSRQQYRNNFHFKTLHFLLTRALQKLRDPNKCQDVFMGMRGLQFQVKPGARVRFGDFESASQSHEVSAQYGNDTMFYVHTCHGADIQKFSNNTNEMEVLIPPFEVFEVANVTREGDTMNIELRSTGSYDCEEEPTGGSQPRNTPYFWGLLLATVAMAVVTGSL